MFKRSAIALFCEDIRDEAGGTVSLIGTLSDNIGVNLLDFSPQERPRTAVPTSGKILSRLCLYTRINFDPDDDIKNVAVRVNFPGDQETIMVPVEKEMIEQSKTQAKTKGNLLAGLITRLVFDGINLQEPGFVKAEVEIDGEIYLAGALNIKHESPEPAKPTPSNDV